MAPSGGYPLRYAEVKNVNTVRSMAKSRYFWMPLFALVMVMLLYSDMCWGLRDVDSVSIDNMAAKMVFDLNLPKIALGIALVILLPGMLYGKGRIAGGLVCLVLALAPAVDGTYAIVIAGTSYLFPLKLVYSMLFLSCWFVLVFYAHWGHVPLKKIIRTCACMAVFVAGVWAMTLFVGELNDRYVSFKEMHRSNEFSFFLAAGLALILLSVTFLRKDITDGEGPAKIFCDIIYWCAFILPLIFSINSISRYISFNRKNFVTNDSPFTLELTILVALIWGVLLFQSMLNYREFSKKDLQSFLAKYIPGSVLDEVFLAPFWVLFAALLFSDLFLGFRGVSIPGNAVSLSFDVNFFKLAAGIVFMITLAGKPQKMGRIVVGWICLLFAFISPVSGVFPIAFSSIYFQFPVKMLYSLLFVSCWFILVFYAHLREIPAGKVVKTGVWMIVFFAGIFEMMVFAIDMNNRLVSFAGMFGNSEVNLYYSLGLAFMLLAATFLWKDINNGESTSILVSEVLFWGLMLVQSVLSLCSIWGYVSLIVKRPLPSASRFALEWTVFGACLWGLLLFQFMYSHRSRRKGIKNSYSFLSNYVPANVLKHVFLAPIWLFLASIPIFVLYVFDIFTFLHL